VKNTFALAVIAAAALPVAAQAETAYVGAGLGSAQQTASIKDFGTVKERDLAVKVFTGYNFDENFGVEAGFSDFGKAEFNSRGDGNKARSFYAAGTATLPLAERWALTGKLGIAKNRSKVVVRGEGDIKDKKTDALIGIGATFAVTKQISAFLEYENYGNVGKPVNGSSLKVAVLSTGIRFSF
jgi:OOP family OmpA-OmpF porin